MMKTRNGISSSAYSTLLIFGAILIAFVIFFADAPLNAQRTNPQPTASTADLEALSQDIQTSLGGAVNVANQLENIRNQLPSFAEFAATAPTVAPVAPAQNAEPVQVDVPSQAVSAVPTAPPTVVVDPPAPTPQPPQVQQVIVEVIVTATFTPSPPPPPAPTPPQPVYQAQTVSYQPAQGGTALGTWVKFQIGHVRGGTYIYSAAGLWMDCTRLSLSWDGRSASSAEGGQIASTLSLQPAQEQIAYYHICDYALKQEGKR